MGGIPMFDFVSQKKGFPWWKRKIKDKSDSD